MELSKQTQNVGEASVLHYIEMAKRTQILKNRHPESLHG
jgi:hypothetical protein